MLPSGLARGPLLGSLYNTVPAKPMSNWLEVRPLIRSQDVRPSGPLLLAQQSARVLHQPGHKRMAGGDILAKSRPKTQLQRAEQSTGDLDADLDPAVGLRLVRCRSFHLDVLHRLPLFEDLGHTVLERHDGAPIVRLQDNPRVA